MYPNLESPPQPIVPRWGSWIAAAIYYADHLQEIRAFLDESDRHEAKSIREATRITQNEELRNDLTFIKCHFSCIPVAITKLEEKGARLLEPRCNSHIQFGSHKSTCDSWSKNIRGERFCAQQ